MEKLKFQRHQESTDKNYYGIWKAFNIFFINLDNKPDSWEDRIALYITYRVNRGDTQSKTIRSHASAIKGILKSEDITIDTDAAIPHSVLDVICALVKMASFLSKGSKVRKCGSFSQWGQSPKNRCV